MNMIRIMAKEFKQTMRDWKANTMMILFPIVLIIILGAAFSGAFGNEIDLSGIKVQYTAGSSQALKESFQAFTEEIGRELSITFEETADEAEGMKNIQDGEYSAFIQLEGDPDEIKIYKNARYDFDANLVESMLRTFVERYDAIAAIARSNPAMLQEIMSDTAMDFVEIEALDKKKQPGSLDYYAVSMLTLILMYASITGFSGIKSEQNGKTGSRILCGPVRKFEFLVGKVVGGITVTLVQAAIVILFSKSVLKANWGNDLLTIFMLIITEALMTISMGAGVAFLIKSEGAAQAVLNGIIPVVVLLGGGYVPITQMGEAIVRISVISPLRWLNTAIFRIIYDADYSLVLSAALINLAVAAVFIAVSAICAKKEGV